MCPLCGGSPDNWAHMLLSCKTRGHSEVLHGEARRRRQEVGQRPARRYDGTVANPSELREGGREPGRHD
eukprot:8141954-Pyramimonas_sp.AAC.1